MSVAYFLSGRLRRKKMCVVNAEIKQVKHQREAEVLESN